MVSGDEEEVKVDTEKQTCGSTYCFNSNFCFLNEYEVIMAISLNGTHFLLIIGAGRFYAAFIKSRSKRSDDSPGSCLSRFIFSTAPDNSELLISWCPCDVWQEASLYFGSFPPQSKFGSNLSSKMWTRSQSPDKYW